VADKELDRARYRSQPWRAWYSFKIWTDVLRPNQLRKTPWCEPCKARGRVKMASAVNHRTPHKGRWSLFADPENLESTCENCHNSMIQKSEGRGFRVTPGADGWPADPDHPFNKRSK
jgi:5-methylcytosine-specific restriction endonuclease McrA|tara:strand:- start:957 stop:1307 length:351 start_codon:yes stop_codon:yes gene_type:complete